MLHLHLVKPKSWITVKPEAISYSKIDWRFK